MNPPEDQDSAEMARVIARCERNGKRWESLVFSFWVLVAIGFAITLAVIAECAWLEIADLWRGGAQ